MNPRAEGRRRQSRRRALSIGVTALLGVICLAPSPPQDPVHRFPADRIVVALPHPYAVRGLLDFTNTVEPGGFAVELVRAAAAAVELEVEFRRIDLASDALEALARGEVDLVAPLSIADARILDVGFTVPILIAHGAVFRLPDTARADNADELSTARVSVARDGVAHQWCLEHGLHPLVTESLREALRLVVDGRAEYCLTTEIAGRVEVQIADIQDLVCDRLDDERIARSFALGTRREQQDLVADLNKGLAIVRDDGRWDQLYDQYVARFQPRPRPRYVTPATLAWVGSIAFLITGIGLVSQWILRRRLTRQAVALRASEANYRAIAESLPGLVYTRFVGVDGKVDVRYVSPARAEWVKHFPQLDASCPWSAQLDGLHPEDLARHTASVSASLRDGTKLDMEYRLRDGDGRYRWVHSLATPLAADGGTLWQGILLDVTPQRAAEEALRESEHKYREIFERCQDALLVVRPETLELHSVNASACALYGRERAELIGARLALVDGERTITKAVARELLAGGQRSGLRDSHLRRDGTRVEVEISVASVEFEQQRLLLAEVRDVSERVRADEERQRLEAQLFQAQKLEGLGVLAGGIAHDFNNLMVGILGNVDLARAHLTQADRARGYLAAAEAATNRAADLTQQLLAYAGRARLTEQSIDLGALTREMVSLVRTSLPAGAKLCFELASDVPPIQGDPTLVRQVVMNLVTNAGDSLKPEGGHIWIRSGLRRYEQAYLTGKRVPAEIPAGEYVFLEIEDSGVGMDEATLDRIFDPFFTTKFTGRGLGLSVVFKTMQRHHGAVKVSSTPGRGTLFQLLFPPRPVTHVPAPEARPSPVACASGLRVLVIDDEPMVREVVRTVLEDRGWRVSEAADGDSGLELARAGDGHDVVLLDLTMPGRSGASTLAELRRTSSGLPVVVMSGLESPMQPEFGGTTAAGYVQKPFTGARLVAAIEAALEKPALPG